MVKKTKMSRPLTKCIFDIQTIKSRLMSQHNRNKCRLRVIVSDAQRVFSYIVPCTEISSVSIRAAVIKLAQHEDISRATASRIVRSVNIVWHVVLAVMEYPINPGFIKSVIAADTPCKKPRKPFTEEEIIKLGMCAEALGAQYACMWHILITTGIRIEALRTIQWGNIYDDKIVVTEKGHRQHITILTPTVKRCLLLLERKNQYVFSTTRSSPLSQRQMRNRFYKLCSCVGITGHPHLTRHTVAQRLFIAGNSVEMISKFLGHRTAQVTHQYLILPIQSILKNISIPWYNK